MALRYSTPGSRAVGKHQRSLNMIEDTKKPLTKVFYAAVRRDSAGNEYFSTDEVRDNLTTAENTAKRNNERYSKMRDNFIRIGTFTAFEVQHG